MITTNIQIPTTKNESVYILSHMLPCFDFRDLSITDSAKIFKCYSAFSFSSSAFLPSIDVQLHIYITKSNRILYLKIFIKSFILGK